MEERPVVMAGRFTEREGKMVKRLAKAQGLTVAEYVRAAVMFTAIMDGDFEAVKITATLVRKKMADALAFAKEGKLVLN